MAEKPKISQIYVIFGQLTATCLLSEISEHDQIVAGLPAGRKSSALQITKNWYQV
jgi:hypothetical protein